MIGARGYVGRELVRLIGAHPRLELALATSEGCAGSPVAGAEAALRYAHAEPGEVAGAGLDVIVLALANGSSVSFLESLERAGAAAPIVLDISADHRFAPDWVYGLPESFARQLAGARRIANPGCYATAMHLALKPLVGMFSTPAHCYGVSGWSGAGATPNDRNDADCLRDSILPYSLVGHLHEREAAHHLNAPVRFAPSVAPFFRGIMLTALVTLDRETNTDEIVRRFESAYASEPLLTFTRDRMPTLGEVVQTPGAMIGGVCVDGADARRIGVVCALDNMLKGAASQAVQNLNLALGFDPAEGLTL